MDRKWMSANRLSKEYRDGVKEFIAFAIRHADDPSRILCPCLDCCHVKRISVEKLREHLVCNGIDESYTCWTKHCELKGESSGRGYSASCASEGDYVSEYEVDHLEEIVNRVEDDLKSCPKMFERLTSDADKPLYSGCTNFTRLSAVLKLFNLKAKNGWSDKSFTELLEILKCMLPSDNELSRRTYDVRQMLCAIGMSYEKIHACPNDCILFGNEYKTLDKCPKCNATRYKKKEMSPAKVVWYFPIIPRFRRMYSSVEDAKNLIWHADERINDGKFRHPTDSPQWKKIDFE